MVARVNTVAFQGIDVLDIDVQVQMASGLPAFTIVCNQYPKTKKSPVPLDSEGTGRRGEAARQRQDRRRTQR